MSPWAVLRVLGLPLVTAVPIGYALAAGLGWDARSSAVLPPLASVVLAVGLYGAAAQIDVAQVRGDARRLLAAVTAGVAVKALLVGGVATLFLGPTGWLVGVVLAQIDPLGTGRASERAEVSPRGRRLLLAWASFDDPATSLAVAGYLVWVGAAQGAGALVGVLGQAAGTVGLVGVGLLARRATRGRPVTAVVLAGGLVLGCGLLGLWAAVAALGVLWRPFSAGTVSWALTVTFWSATALAGTLLVGGIEVVGLALGVAAVAAQAVVAPVLTRGLPRADRVVVAVSQVNGLTSVILAVALAPVAPVVPAVVLPAVVATAVVFTINSAWSQLWLTRRGPAPS